MRISRIYRALCEINGAEPAHDIERFVIMSRARAADHLLGNIMPDREALLIQEEEDGLRLGLYLAPEVIASVELADPLERLDEFACAVEGISHFLYVTDRAEKERPVTRLELELQAEVDKFVLINLCASGSSGGAPYSLFERQFSGFRLDERLGSEERELYALSSRLAAKLCARLRGACFNPLDLRSLKEKAREFFKRDLKEKVSLLTP